jgi:G3E family GTPase
LDMDGGREPEVSRPRAAEKLSVADGSSLPVLVIGGFLGSGKTTFLLGFARWLTEQGRRVGILVNEAGAVDIDGVVLASEGHRVQELFGGCACCSLVGEVRPAAEALREWGAELLLVEPSGMADLARMADLLGSRVAVVALVDVPRLGVIQRAAPRLVGDGVTRADLVLLNKVDVASDGDRAAARRWLEDTVPGGSYVEVSAERGVSQDVWEEVLTLLE